MTGLTSVSNTLFSTEEGGKRSAADSVAVGAAVPVDEDSPRAEQSVLPFMEATNA